MRVRGPVFASGGLLAGAVCLLVGGCTLVSPLEEYPSAVENGGSGGRPAGGAGGKGAVASGGSPEAGPGGAPTGGCRTNKECSDDGAGEPHRCRPDGQCVALKTEECPLVYGDADSNDAVFVGAFAPLNPSAPDKNSIVWSHRLALEELSGDNVGGLPGGKDGGRRPIVMTVCNSDAEVLDRSLDHLVANIQVPAMLATLLPGDLRRAFEKYPNEKPFFLNPVGSTRTIVDYPDGGRIWSILGQPSDLAPAYSRLLNLLERYVRTTRALERPTRVALVTTTEAFDSDLANFVPPVLRFNGESVTTNRTAGNYKGFTVDLAAPKLVELVKNLVEFRPDIVVSAAGEVFTMTGGIVEGIETDWEDPIVDGSVTTERPFYLLSPTNAGDLSGLAALIEGFIETRVDAFAEQRFVGVAAAPAPDSTLQNAYSGRLLTKFDKANVDTGNYYDAFYFLAYALYAAGDGPLDGPAVAAGMKRLVAGPPLDVGPLAISTVFDALADGASTISLDGTLGPPNFDVEKGVRVDDGSVFCFERNKVTGLTLRTAVLRYDRQTDAFEGTFPCYSGFFP